MTSSRHNAWPIIGCVTVLINLLGGAWAQTSSYPTPPETIQFHEFFSKVSVEGLEFSPKLRALDGKPVRLIGYMVQQEHMSPDHFFLAARPLKLCPDCGGVTMLPYDVVRVNIVSTKPGSPLRYISGPITVIGILSLGNREEADGTVSLIRLTVRSLTTDSAPAGKEVKPSPARQDLLNKPRRRSINVPKKFHLTYRKSNSRRPL